MNGLRKQHVHTIRPLVWDTLEDLPPLGLHTWDEDSKLHARGRISYTDEHLNYRTSFNSRDEYNLTWACMANHVEEMMDKRKTWRPRKFTSVEKMSCPCQLKMYRDKMEEGHGWWSFKDHGNNTPAPIVRGAYVQSVCKAAC